MSIFWTKYSPYDRSLAVNLLESPKYHEMSGYFYGTEFFTLISNLVSGIGSGQFIRAMLKLHQQVENKRKSGVWIDIEGEVVMAYSGYEYARVNMNRQHSFKIDNLLKIIDDLGWPA